MKNKKLLDKHISFKNYATFKRCDILNAGRSLKFTMACGDSYKIPTEYLLNWFNHPHYLEADNILMPWKNTKKKVIDRSEKVLKCEKVLRDGAIRVYFNNGAVYDVAWDTILMSCDEQYEHFGGLTDESKITVKNWFESKKDQIVILRKNKKL